MPESIPPHMRPPGASRWESAGSDEAEEVRVVSEPDWSPQGAQAVAALEEGLAVDSVTQIDGYGPHKFSAQHNGVHQLMSGIAFRDVEEYMRWLKKLVDEAKDVTTWEKIRLNGMGVVTLPIGARLLIYLPPVSNPYPTFSLRKHTAAKWAPSKFVESMTMDERMMRFLQAAVAARVNILFVGQMGSGKAGSVDEPILTPTGWTTYGEIKPGDEVIGRDGETQTVLGVYPQGELETFKVTFSDGSWTECSDDHLWEVTTPWRKSAGKAPQVKTLRELRGNLHDAAGNANYYIPLVDPVEFKEQGPLPLDPYLVGCLIGDGCLIDPSPRFTTADEEILVGVGAAQPAGHSTRPIAGYDHRIVGSGGKGGRNEVSRALRGLGLYGKRAWEKHIPGEYMFASFETRLALFQGLMDTDGTKPTPGKSTLDYTTTSPQLAEDMRFLVQSFGGTCHLSERQTYYTYKGEKRAGRTAYRLHISLPRTIVPFRLDRKLELWTPPAKYQPTRAIVAVEPVGSKQCVCIKVSNADELYVTRDFIVTHNTTLLRALTSYFGDNERIAVVEQIPELKLGKPLAMQRVYQPTVEGLGLGEVLDFELYDGLDRLIVGEVHLAGITKMLEVMIMTEGSMSTYHAFSTEQAGERMKLALQVENPNLSAQTAVSFIRQAVELVVVSEKIGAKRRVMQISEIDWRSTGGGGEILGGSDLFRYDRREQKFKSSGRKPDEQGRIMKKAEKYEIAIEHEWFLDAEHLEQFKLKGDQGR